SLCAKHVSASPGKRRSRCPVSGCVSIISLQMLAASACLLLLWRTRLSEVLDIRKNERSAEIKGLSEPQVVFYSSQNGELYVASGGDGTLRIYDGSTLKIRQTLELGADADNVRNDGHPVQILVGFGSGGLGLVDASGQRVATIPLNSHPESFQ